MDQHTPHMIFSTTVLEEEAKQSSCKEKRIASVIKYMLNIRLFPKARLKNFLNYTHLREGNTVSQQRIIEVQVKVTE